MKPKSLDYLVEAVRSPSEQLSRGQHFVRQSWELALYCWRQLQRQRAEGMAAELTYRTVFSLIPVVVLGLVMFRIFGGLEEVQNNVEYQLYSFFGVPEIPDSYLSPAEQEASAVVNGEFETSGQAFQDFQDAVASDTPGKTATALDEVAPNEADDPEGTERTEPTTLGERSAQQLEAADATIVSGDAVISDQDRLGEDVEAAIKDAAIKDAAIEETKREARASIRRKLHEVTSMVASIDFKSIGVFGLLLFVYAAIALADSVEHLFNRIYDAPAQRPVHLRLAIHWSIITLGSGLLAMSLYMSGQVIEWTGTVGADSNTRWILSHLLSMAASWVLMFLLYALMPNTHVSVRSAMIGSLVGAILWEAAKYGFQIYVVKAVPYSNIYGSIGLIPLFLFWIYVTWWIVLFGLILTYTLQTFGGRLPEKLRERESSSLHGDPDWMLPIMCEVGRAFAEGKPINHQDLADQIGLSSREVHEMTEPLIQANLLQRLAGEEDCLTLGRPAERIEIADILNLAHHLGPTNDHPAWKALANLKQAERDAAAGKTLADLVA